MLSANLLAQAGGNLDKSAAHRAFVNSYENKEHRKIAESYKPGKALRLYRTECVTIMERIPLSVLFKDDQMQNRGAEYWYVLLYDENQLVTCEEFRSNGEVYEDLGNTTDELAFAIQELILAKPSLDPVIVSCSQRDYFYHYPELGDSNLTPLSVASVSSNANVSKIAKRSLWLRLVEESKMSESEQIADEYRRRYYGPDGKPVLSKRLQEESDFVETEHYWDTGRWFRENYQSPY